ncbi:MAG: hypothetical protein ABI877_03660 [Gemmatimonadaceae bacterium]
MRLLLIISAMMLTVVGCGGGLDPNAPILTSFTYNENGQPGAGDIPYDSVKTASRTITVGRAAFGNLCAGRLTSGVVSAGSEVTLNVIQSPITSCAVRAALVSYSGNIQLIPGTYHLRVIETNGAHPQGAVVIDQTVVVPAVD